MKPKEEFQKIKGFQQSKHYSRCILERELLMGRVEVHHSIGLFDLVECDGSRYGRPIKRVRENARANE